MFWFVYLSTRPLSKTSIKIPEEIFPRLKQAVGNVLKVNKELNEPDFENLGWINFCF